MSLTTIHASCVVFANKGVLIRGPSGSGKSDLVLRLIDAHSAKLVADDQVILELREAQLFARPPESLAGKLEIRGQGIVDMDHLADIKIVSVVDLVSLAEIERMAKAHELQTTIASVVLPRLKLYAPSASAPARIRVFLENYAANSF